MRRDWVPAFAGTLLRVEAVLFVCSALPVRAEFADALTFSRRGEAVVIAPLRSGLPYLITVQCAA